ncbi:MAG: hypothetical protein P8J37_07975 [Fuerstiella sp.]|nr:hypothetical protein [Fuerstiella sp.]
MEDLRKKTDELDGFPTTLNKRNRIRLTVPLIGELNGPLLEKLTRYVNIQETPDNLQIANSISSPQDVVLITIKPAWISKKPLTAVFFEAIISRLRSPRHHEDRGVIGKRPLRE